MGGEGDICNTLKNKEFFKKLFLLQVNFVKNKLGGKIPVSSLNCFNVKKANSRKDLGMDLVAKMNWKM